MRVIVPIPSNDFDPTEVAVPWKILKTKNANVLFSTPDEKMASADPIVLNGKGLGIWSNILRADRNGIEAYGEMLVSNEFRSPIAWSAIRAEDFDGIILPGGHAPGMKPYLESEILQKTVCDFFATKKLVGAICHGTVLCARSLMPDGKSVLYGRTTTALLKSQELSAWMMTCTWLGRYYRTYSQTVESEVRSALGPSGVFLRGPLPLKRDSLDELEFGFVVEDENYISARWPGDAHRFAMRFASQLGLRTGK